MDGGYSQEDILADLNQHLAEDILSATVDSQFDNYMPIGYAIQQVESKQQHGGYDGNMHTAEEKFYETNIAVASEFLTKNIDSPFDISDIINYNDEEIKNEDVVSANIVNVIADSITMDSNVTNESFVTTDKKKKECVKKDSKPTCDICYMTLKSLCALRRHKSSEHVGNFLYCDKCDGKYKSISELDRHKLSHTDFKEFECHICHTQFKHIYHLKTHMLIHSVDLHVCDVCTFKCADPDEMERHKTSAHGNKSLACNLCNFRCGQKGILERHKNIHSALMRFSCDVCAFKCRLPSKLRQHVLEVHSGERLFGCELCAFRTKHMLSLNRHRIVHTGEKPFQCDVCHFRCNRSSNLDKHKMTHRRNKS